MCFNIQVYGKVTKFSIAGYKCFNLKFNFISCDASQTCNILSLQKYQQLFSSNLLCLDTL